MENTANINYYEAFNSFEREILSKIIELANTYPNDQELGKHLRLLLTTKPRDTSQYLLYLDNSHEKGY